MSGHFDREGEVIRGCFVPLLEDPFFGQSIEGMIDFDRPEMAAVMMEPVRALPPRRVEHPAGPVFVIPAACPHQAACSHRGLLYSGFGPRRVDFDHIISETAAGILNKIKVFGKLINGLIHQLAKKETDFSVCGVANDPGE
jgi:hypothetical protein